MLGSKITFFCVMQEEKDIQTILVVCANHRKYEPCIVIIQPLVTTKHPAVFFNSGQQLQTNVKKVHKRTEELCLVLSLSIDGIVFEWLAEGHCSILLGHF